MVVAAAWTACLSKVKEPALVDAVDGISGPLHDPPGLSGFARSYRLESIQKGKHCTVLCYMILQLG